jgi:hypothetical protein
MRQRKKEMEAIIKVLESEHEDVEELSSEIWKLVDGFRRDREVYAVAVRVDGLNFLYGPYESENLAMKDVELGSIKSVGSTKDRYMILKLLSPSKIFDTTTPSLFDVR